MEHQQTYKGEKLHVRCECGRAFLRNFSLLNIRRRIWEINSMYAVYGKALYRKFKLTEHQRTHTGEKAYKCTECGKAFFREGKTCLHTNKTKQEKTHVCSECGKLSPENHSSFCIRKFIQERNLIYAVSVGKVSYRRAISFATSTNSHWRETLWMHWMW